MNLFIFRSVGGLILVLCAGSVSLLGSNPQDYLRQYSGAYNIYVQGMGSNEAYALKIDGTAVWVYGWKDKDGSVQTQTKKGSWSAGKGLIKVFIQGNTGKIMETYRLTNGRFVSVDDKARYLKKRN